MTVNIGNSKLLKENRATYFWIGNDPKVVESCVLRASWSSCSGPQEALGTRVTSSEYGKRKDPGTWERNTGFFAFPSKLRCTKIFCSFLLPLLDTVLTEYGRFFQVHIHMFWAIFYLSIHCSVIKSALLRVFLAGQSPKIQVDDLRCHERPYTLQGLQGSKLNSW